MNLKIIDWEIKGNVARLYLGQADLKDYWGDDWEDAPYEHNAGPVFDEFIAGYCDIYFPFEYIVLEPKDQESLNNSSYSKDSFKTNNLPIIVFEKEDVIYSARIYTYYYNTINSNPIITNSKRLYLNMSLQNLELLLILQDIDYKITLIK